MSDKPQGEEMPLSNADDQLLDQVWDSIDFSDTREPRNLPVHDATEPEQPQDK